MRCRLVRKIDRKTVLAEQKLRWSVALGAGAGDPHPVSSTRDAFARLPCVVRAIVDLGEALHPVVIGRGVRVKVNLPKRHGLTIEGDRSVDIDRPRSVIVAAAGQE